MQKSGIVHQLLIVLVDQQPCYRGLKSKNHWRELGETLNSLGRDRTPVTRDLHDGPDTSTSRSTLWNRIALSAITRAGVLPIHAEQRPWPAN
jgi:hypothetical protein